MDEQTGTGQEEAAASQPHDDEPGGESTPRDDSGEGSVGLEDRTRQRGGPGDDTGAPAANQGKAEPMPSTPGDKDPNAPLEPPPLEAMNVGAADPQSPRHPLAAGSGLAVDAEVASPPADLGGAGAAPAAQRPAASTGSSTGRAPGPEKPDSDSIGVAHQAPGIQGSTGPDEAVETDMTSSATEMGPSGPSADVAEDEPGDAQGVPVPSHDASPGTSEEHDVVRGARTATHDD